MFEEPLDKGVSPESQIDIGDPLLESAEFKVAISELRALGPIFQRLHEAIEKLAPEARDLVDSLSNLQESLVRQGDLIRENLVKQGDLSSKINSQLRAEIGTFLKTAKLCREFSEDLFSGKSAELQSENKLAVKQFIQNQKFEIDPANSTSIKPRMLQRAILVVTAFVTLLVSTLTAKVQPIGKTQAPPLKNKESKFDAMISRDYGILKQEIAAREKFIEIMTSRGFNEVDVIDTLEYLDKYNCSFQLACEYASLGRPLTESSEDALQSLDVLISLENPREHKMFVEAQIILTLLLTEWTPERIKTCGLDPRIPVSNIPGIFTALSDAGLGASDANNFAPRFFKDGQIALLISHHVSAETANMFPSNLTVSEFLSLRQQNLSDKFIINVYRDIPNPKEFFDILSKNYNYSSFGGWDAIDTDILYGQKGINLDLLKQYPKELLQPSNFDIPAIKLYSNQIPLEKIKNYCSQLKEHFSAYEIANAALYNYDINQLLEYRNAMRDHSHFDLTQAVVIRWLENADVTPTMFKEQALRYEALGVHYDVLKFLIARNVPVDFAQPLIQQNIFSSKDILTRHLKSALSKDQLQTLKDEFNIDEDSLPRYNLKALQELLNNLNPEYNKEKPAALFVLPLANADNNGAFLIAFDWLNDAIKRGFKVYLYQAESDTDVLYAFQKVSSAAPISLAILGAHGSPTVSQFGANSQTLDVQDAKIFKEIGACMARNPNLPDIEPSVIFYSCETGQALAAAAYDGMDRKVTIVAPLLSTGLFCSAGSPVRYSSLDGATICYDAK